MQIGRKPLVLSKLITWVVVFVLSFQNSSYGLGIIPVSNNPVLKRQVMAALKQPNIRYAYSDYEKNILRANCAECVLLSNGGYLVSESLSNDDVNLIGSVIYSEVKAVMEILENEYKEGRSVKYEAIKNIVLDVFPMPPENKLPVNVYVNKIIARAFKYLIMTHKKGKMMLIKEMLSDEQKFLDKAREIIKKDKNNCFTDEFWNSNERKRQINKAHEKGQVFYQVADLPESKKTNDIEPQGQIDKKPHFQDNLVNNLYYESDYNVRVSYISRISQSFIDRIAEKLPGTESNKFLDKMETIPGFFMYDAETGTFLKIYEEYYLEFIALAERAGYKNIEKKLEEIAQIELSVAACLQSSIGFPSSRSIYFKNIGDHYYEEFEKISKHFRLSVPDEIDFTDPKLMDFTYTLIAKFFVSKLLQLDSEEFGTHFFQDKAFMKTFVTAIGSMMANLNSQYQSLLTEDERQLAKVYGSSYYTLMEKEKITEYFFNQSNFKEFTSFTDCFWAKRKVKAVLGSRLVLVEDNYVKRLEIYSAETQEKFWIQLAQAAVEIEAAGVNPRVLLYDFFHFGFPQGNRNFTASEFSELIDLVKNTILTMKKKNIEITLYEKDGGPNTPTHFTMFACKYLNVDPSIIVRTFRMHFDMVKKGIDYSNSVYAFSRFLTEIYKFKDVEESYTDRVFILAEKLIKKNIDPGVFFRFIELHYKGRTLEERLWICEANVNYHSARYIIETLLDLQTYFQKNEVMFEFFSTIKRLNLKNGDLLAWSSAILWIVSSFGGQDEKKRLINDYLKKLDKRNSVKTHLMQFRNMLLEKYTELNDFEKEAIKDLDTFIKLCGICEEKHKKTRPEDNMFSVYNKAGITQEEISRLLRVTYICLKSSCDVYCTFWR
ncbi:MAG: hypothetical protein ABIH09_00640, partial [Candidatus Omnitrophota bacterium]